MSDDSTRILAAIERLELGQSRLETGQKALATREELTHLSAELMGRMDRLENNLTSIRDDITVNYAAADHTTPCAR